MLSIRIPNDHNQTPDCQVTCLGHRFGLIHSEQSLPTPPNCQVNTPRFRVFLMVNPVNPANLVTAIMMFWYSNYDVLVSIRSIRSIRFPRFSPSKNCSYIRIWARLWLHTTDMISAECGNTLGTSLASKLWLTDCWNHSVTTLITFNLIRVWALLVCV